MSFVADTDDLRLLLADLAKAEAAAPREIRPIAQKGALNIKQDWQRRWSGLGHAPHIPRAITFDTTLGATKVEAEIGPDKGRTQGALGNIFEFGSVNNAPIPGGVPALQAEAPRFERALTEALGDPL